MLFHKNGILLFILGILCSCSVQEIDFSPKNFSEEVQPLQNLIFKFNTAMVEEKDLNKWISANYLQFEPTIPGKYKWLSKNELVFSPIKPLAPSTNYKVKLKELPKPTTPEKSKLPLTNKEISFHTPYLRFADITPYWTQNGQTPELRLILHFNYEISPDIITENLKITIDNQNIPFSVITRTKSSKIEIVTQNIELKEVIQPLKVQLSKGIHIDGSNFSSSEDLIFETQVPNNQLEIIKTDTQHDGFTGTFTLYANHSLETSNLNSLIQIDPKIPFTVETHQNQLSIQGEFLQNQSYQIKILKGLTSVLNTSLNVELNYTASFGENGKFIQFANQNSIYLNAQGNKKVALHILNVDQFKVRVSKVFENNLVNFLKNYNYYGLYLYLPEDDATIIYEKSYELKDLQKIGNIYALDLDFENILPSYHGIYIVEVFSEVEYYVQAFKIVCITDIGLIAKINSKEAIIFANKLSDNQPISGLNVKLYSQNNQIIGTAETGPGGMAIIRNIDLNAQYFEPALITASTKEDFTFLWFNTTRWDNVDYDVEGKKFKSPHYDAMIYAERPLYRPGETAHLNTIVRTHDWKNISQMPVTFKILNPRNQIVLEEYKKLDTQSAMKIDFEIPVNAPTGNYLCQIYAGNSELIQSYSFTVEEFLPDKLKVNTYLETESKQRAFKSTEEIKLNLQASHFYGSPAAGYTYEVTFSPRPLPFSPKGFEKYHFELVNSANFVNNLVKNGKTDNEGKSQVIFKFPEEWKNTGYYQATFSTAVFDENNRPVYHNLTENFFTQDVFFGIYKFDTYVQANTPINAPIIAVDYTGKILQNIPAKVQVLHHTYETVLQRVYYHTSFQTVKKSKKIYEKILTLNGEKTLLDFTPTLGGEYEIRIFTPGIEKSFVSYPFYAFGYWGNTTNFETDPKGRIIIETHKNSYSYNEKAKILFKTPFEGKLLITVERDKLLQHFTLQTKNQSAVLDLNLQSDFVPNIFICATLIRPYLNAELPLMVAHGAKKIIVENPYKKIPVQILANQKVKSRTLQTITIQTRPYAHVTFAAVDEGILQIKASKTPNPYDYFYGPRALTVQQYDVYAKILREIGGKTFAKASKIGGGVGLFEADALNSRNNPIMSNPAKKFVSFWKYGQADATGKIQFNIHIPAFAGSLRLMAQSYYNDQFGAAEKNMIVADPIVLNLGTPLFASPGDTLLIPITLHNTTSNSFPAQISLITSPLIQVVNLTSNQFHFTPNQEQKAFAKLVIQNDIGVAKIKLQVKANREIYEQENEISVRPASPLQFQGKGGWIEGGKSITVQTENYSFIPSTQSFKLVVSTNPVAQFAKNLNDLIHYPHGCAEQTISTAFPQLYVMDLSKSLLKTQELKSNPKTNIQAAITKIENLMDYTGGVAYWENSYVNWWTTAYAGHFLKEAANNGYDVRPSTLKSIANYLRNQTNQNFVLKQGEFYPREIAYSLYVLAKMGWPNASKMNFYKSRLNQFTADSKLILGCAFALSGDYETFQQIIQTPFEYTPKSSYDLDFSSSLRERALILNTLLDVNPDHPWISTYLTQLMEEVQNAKYLNTQELAFSLMAFAKIAHLNKNQNISAQVFLNGSSYTVNKNQPLVLELKKLANFQIKTQGQGKLYYSYVVSGVDAKGHIVEEDQWIKVRRTYLDRNGNPINGKISVNDLIQVKIEIQPLQNQRISNIAIVDMIPSGFQIENERLNFVNNQLTNANYDYKDIRDDRVIYYVSLENGKKELRYYLRAVQRGTFTVPPIAADAMYNGNIHSYYGKGKISVN